MNQHSSSIATGLYYQTMSLEMNGYSYHLRKIKQGQYEIKVFRYGTLVCELVAGTRSACISQAFQQLFVLAKGA